jgi:hypothetical protein
MSNSWPVKSLKADDSRCDAIYCLQKVKNALTFPVTGARTYSGRDLNSAHGAHVYKNRARSVCNTPSRGIRCILYVILNIYSEESSKLFDAVSPA